MRRPATVFIALALLGVPVILGGCQAKQGGSASPSPAAYQILDKSESRLGGKAPIYYRVLVPPGTSADGLKQIAAQVVAQAKQGRAFSILWIAFYDYPELQEHAYAGPPLGFIRYGGTSAGRNPTAPGDYAEMSFTFELSSRDWEKRPSQNDVTWAVYRLELLRRAESHGKSPSPQQLDARTGRHFGVTAGKVALAVERVEAWVTEEHGRIW